MNNTENKLILDRESWEKLHKKLRFADPVFITSGIYKCTIKPETEGSLSVSMIVLLR